MNNHKKSILIISHSMELGGAERALIGLLEAFEYKRYSVDIFLLRHKGELLDMIPKEANLLPEIKDYASLAVPLIQVIRNRNYKIAIGRFYGKVRANLYIRSHNLKEDNGVELEYSHKYTKKFMPMISSKEYDLVVSFLTPHYFAAEKAIGKKKIAWIHTDYSRLDIDIKSELSMWDKYDYIASISESCSKGFCLKFPYLSNKLVLIENIQSKEYIINASKAVITDEEWNKFNGIRILSIGRFSFAKNFDNIPAICSELLKHRNNLRWYLIGYGADEALIRQKIKEANVDDRVIILGKKSNPYPYISNCDIYIQPSRYEGKAVAVREAQLLNKPVVISNYSTSESQLIDGFDGVIAHQDNYDFALVVSELLNDPMRLKALSENTKSKDYTSIIEIQKLYKLMEM